MELRHHPRWLPKENSSILPSFLRYQQIHEILQIQTQLEELLEPYLADTDLGVPYWDWTKNLNIPKIWKDIFTPLKEPQSKYYEREREKLQKHSKNRKKFKAFFK